eukprot:3130054-Rhodomonas_salina.2
MSETELAHSARSSANTAEARRFKKNPKSVGLSAQPCGVPLETCMRAVVPKGVCTSTHASLWARRRTSMSTSCIPMHAKSLYSLPRSIESKADSQSRRQMITVPLSERALCRFQQAEMFKFRFESAVDQEFDGSEVLEEEFVDPLRVERLNFLWRLRDQFVGHLVRTGCACVGEVVENVGGVRCFVEQDAEKGFVGVESSDSCERQEVGVHRGLLKVKCRGGSTGVAPPYCGSGCVRLPVLVEKVFAS